MEPGSYRFAVAPMMDWTDRHCRFFLRQFSRRALLYTEMVATGAVLHGDRAYLLGFDPAERPLALQLGGVDPAELAESARIGAGFGYDEINLNVGCPSDRVRSGRFGACLMAEPELVGRSVEAMRKAVDIPVTVKSRIAIDAQAEWPTLSGFARTVREAGADRLIVHARKAWLKGLSPKQNRDIPPLRYDLVRQLKTEMPEFTIVLNGGLRGHEAIADELGRLDGVMLGRAAYQNPFLLSEVDRRYFEDLRPGPSRHDIALRMTAYIEAQMSRGVKPRAITRHMMGLYQGQRGARAWRRRLSELAADGDLRLVQEALKFVEDTVAQPVELLGVVS